MDSLPAALPACYQEPLAALVALGRPPNFQTDLWPDYPAEFGLGPEHIDELIRMATDLDLYGPAENSPEDWSGLHAWRALGQLRAEAAATPLLDMLRAVGGDDAAMDEVPVVLGMIGPSAIPRLAEWLDDRDLEPWLFFAASSAIKEIAERHETARDSCVALLAAQLEPARGIDSFLAGAVVAQLLDLNAIETYDIIRAAFERDAIDITIAGDLEDVEISFGLRTARATPRVNRRRNLMQRLGDRWNERTPEEIYDLPPRAEAGRNDPCPCGSGKKYKKCCL
ncbi:MAG TPA: SEC-C metal-binding domain-containing protein [Acetobacteraceae bacterium]|nr:SEC-C metal-binding domain-containing protein [Acetobacteraceae bacterium]